MNKESLLEAAAEMERLEAKRDREEMVLEAVQTFGWRSLGAEKMCREVLANMLDNGIGIDLAVEWLRVAVNSGRIEEDVRRFK